jgi:hypothetical protein
LLDCIGDRPDRAGDDLEVPMHRRSVILAATLALAGGALAGGAVSAQEMSMTPHPAHIHAGTCPAPGDVVAPLTDVAASMDGEMMGQASYIPVQTSMTTVDLPLADILGGTHAIVVHQSADDMGTYVLCGDIGGAAMGGTMLAVGLGPVADPTFHGIATLTDGGDGTTQVTIYLTHTADMMAPMESPAM